MVILRLIHPCAHGPADHVVWRVWPDEVRRVGLIAEPAIVVLGLQNNWHPSWSGATSSLGFVVRMVNVRSHCSLASSFRFSQRPANALLVLSWRSPGGNGPRFRPCNPSPLATLENCPAAHHAATEPSGLFLHV